MAGRGGHAISGQVANDDSRVHNGDHHGDVVNNYLAQQREKSFFNTLPQRWRNERLLKAAKEGQLRRLKLLLHADADVDSRTGQEAWEWESSGSTPLILASRYGHLDCVDELIHHGADVNACSTEGTALWTAVVWGQMAALRKLISYKADPNVFPSNGTSPLYETCRSEDASHMEIAKALLAAGAKPNGNKANACAAEQPLSIAAYHNKRMLVNLLLEHGADANAVASDGGTPLMAAMAAYQHSDVDISRLLLDKGADISSVRNDGLTALHIAADIGHFAAAELLLDRGADVNLKCISPSKGDNHGYTPLHFAVQGHVSHLATTTLLVDRGANINAISDDSRAVTPLHWAVKDADHSTGAVVNFLVDHGANLEALARLRQGLVSVHGTPLAWAIISNNNVKIMKLLLERGAGIEARSETSDRTWNQEPLRTVSVTPLMLSVSDHRKDAVMFLLQHGADPNARDERGDTALGYAVSAGFAPLVRILLAQYLEQRPNGIVDEELVRKAERRGATPILALLNAASGGSEAFKSYSNSLDSDALGPIDSAQIASAQLSSVSTWSVLSRFSARSVRSEPGYEDVGRSRKLAFVSEDE